MDALLSETRASADVLAASRIAGVQQFVALVPARSVRQEVLVQLDDGRVLVRLADLVGRVLVVNGLGAGRPDFRN